MIFILDTNIYVSDFFFKGPGFRVLKGLFLKTACKLIIPNIVQSETLKIFDEHLRKAVADSKKAISRVVDTEIFTVGFEDQKIKEFKSLFIRHLNSLTNDGVEEDCTPDIEINELIQKSLDGKKPFTTDGKKGFRDSIIWEHVKKALQENPKQEVVFLSSNYHDFASKDDSKSIHPELKN